MDGAIEGGGIGEGLVCQMMGFEIVPDHLDVVELGCEATVHLAEQMDLKGDMTILDIGCGIGGPARFLAGHYGCTVVGIDVTPEYVAVAESLTQMVALAGLVSFRLGCGTALPFDAASFDAGTLIHVGMNIPDKERLCVEAARVLKLGGVFGVYEVMRNGEADLAYPVPWAETAALSFLATPAAYRQALEKAGFIVVAEENRRAFALDFFEQMRARMTESGPPPLGLHIHLGPNASQKVTSVIENLERDVIAPVEMICRRAEA